MFTAHFHKFKFLMIFCLRDDFVAQITSKWKRISKILEIFYSSMTLSTKKYFIFVTSAMVQEICVHLQHLFLEIRSKFNVTVSILKKMVELNSLSTRMRKCIYFMNLIVQGLKFGRRLDFRRRLDFWDSLELHCIHISTVRLRNRPGFATLYGIHVASCFGIVFPSVIVSLHVFYLCHHLSLLHLN